MSNDHVVDSLTGMTMVQLYNEEVNSVIHATCYGRQGADSVTCKQELRISGVLDSEMR